MRTGNAVQSKSYAFAVKVVRLHQQLHDNRAEPALSRQLLRAGTSVGANIEEAIGGQSKADFINKLSIAYKEARESSYWLRLLKDTGYIPETQFRDLHGDAEELCRIIGAIQRTAKARKD